MISNIAKDTAELLELKTDHARLFLEVCIENAILMDKKQQDYGPHNIAGFGEFGVVVRMNDKFERLKTLMRAVSTQGKRAAKPKNESIHDTLQDIANYACIAIQLRTNRWPLS